MYCVHINTSGDLHIGEAMKQEMLIMLMALLLVGIGLGYSIDKDTHGQQKFASK